MKFKISSHYNSPSEIAYVPNIQKYVDDMTKPTIDEINHEKDSILSELDVKEFVTFLPKYDPDTGNKNLHINKIAEKGYVDFISILHNIEVRLEALQSLLNDNRIDFKDRSTSYRKIELHILHSTGDYDFDICFDALPYDTFIKH